MTAYYNEIDPFAAAWLRELIKAGHIAPGDVDDRSIVDIRPSELAGYTQCHFFAGIGVWSYALRRAGWPDDRAVWTGSCPCQPFSAAGKGGGFDDERHLWPHWHHLIRECGPSIVFGEQVASKDGLNWLDLVCADMEGEGYAVGAVDTCSAGHGAPHIRQRLRFVAERGVGQADAYDAGLALRSIPDVGRRIVRNEGPAIATRGVHGGLADAEHDGWRQHGHGVGRAQGAGEGIAEEWQRLRADPADGDAVGGLADTIGAERLHGQPGERVGDAPGGRFEGPAAASGLRHDLRPGPTNGFWRDADWLFCRDGKWRPVEPGTFPLANGAPARVGRLRGYGNAVDAQATAAFIEAYLDGTEGR